MSVSFFEDVGGPTTALALHKSTSQVAVAGRSVLKIYSIEDDKFNMMYNLRVVKNTMASCNDVAWNQVDENILASATPSGAIVTWNLSKSGFSKMDAVYQDHKRPVNKIHFHSNDPWLLLSGSQDSIKVFDLRHNEAVISYSGLSESIRDLQFSPHKANSFIAVQDNGYVQLFDIRRKDKSEQCFPGHYGPIFACDWHPEQADIVATAGRDMSIKVWCLLTQTPMMQHCIPTMESVSKIRWSFDDRNLVASSSLKRDFSINVWDIHRPYIALARFTEPHEITTGIAWRRGKYSLVSITSNGTLYQLPMSEAYRPLEHTNPIGMAINPDGDIALALGDGLIKANFPQNVTTDNSASTTGSSPSNQTLSFSTPLQNSLPTKFPHQALLSYGRQSLTRRSQDSALRVSRISSKSQLDVYKNTEMNWFVKTAQEYKLSRGPLSELCDHNAEVCARLKRFQICQTWKILKLFYANIPTSSTATVSHQSHKVPGNVSRPGIVASDDLSMNSQIPGSSEFSYMYKNQDNQGALTPNKSLSGLSRIDRDSTAESEQSNESTDDWLSNENISYEAFQPKQDIFNRVEKLMDPQLDDSASNSSSSERHEDEELATQSNLNTLRTFSNLTDSDNFKLSHQFNSKAYQYKLYEIIADVIADVLKYHVDNSDVQSAVSILIVLGDRIKNIVNERIPEVDRESWYYSYIDLLSKFQLWNVMAQVINLSPLTNINSINQTSTTIYTACGSCGRPLSGKVGWICDRCKTIPSECSVCHGIVVGLMAWCQGCYHGGHLIHMSQWYSENEYCPTGCGHLCELSQWR